MTDTASIPLASTVDVPAQATSQPVAHLDGQQDAGSRPNLKAKKAQGPRGPNPVLERLFELYPKMFGARFLPLKLGVFQELMALHAGEFKKDELKLALGQHVRSTRYLESVAAGAKRHDLQGQAVEDVAPEHVHHAILEVFRRRQARSKEDLRPGLRDRLVQAVDASGLTREAYEERVHTQDEMLAAVLNDAFAVLAERAAKREALRVAFEASGRSVAEFAEMYGMDPAIVRYALKRSQVTAVPPALTPVPAPTPTPISASDGTAPDAQGQEGDESSTAQAG